MDSRPTCALTNTPSIKTVNPGGYRPLTGKVREARRGGDGSLFKVAKGIGSTRWHTHDDQDETFLVIDGTLTIELGHRDVVLAAGDPFVVPRGTEHRPVAENEPDSSSSERPPHPTRPAESLNGATTAGIPNRSTQPRGGVCGHRKLCLMQRSAPKPVIYHFFPPDGSPWARSG
ncbi:cupin domain-containing protein [Mycobacteroides abscessus]|uniref:cupin domain-containing protein n=1 Tax=Mycobacteroides abscessus TaxID=36809 RepID=UPI00352BEA0C